MATEMVQGLRRPPVLWMETLHNDIDTILINLDDADATGSLAGENGLRHNDQVVGSRARSRSRPASVSRNTARPRIGCQTRGVSNRPEFLATNGEIFSLPSVVASYHTRPPYPEAMFDALDRLVIPGDYSVLELGCGPGMVARALCARGRRVVAVDPSEAMIALGKTLEHGDSSRLEWVCSSAEAFAYPERYGLVLAALSIHWMDWDVVFPAIRQALAGGASLALVTSRRELPPWNAELQPLISEYSTIRNWVEHDLLELLTDGGYFKAEGSMDFPATNVSSVEDYIESFHARSGFAREWMGETRAREFDEKLRSLLARHGVSDSVELNEAYLVTWGEPGC